MWRLQGPSLSGSIANLVGAGNTPKAMVFDGTNMWIAGGAKVAKVQGGDLTNTSVTLPGTVSHLAFDGVHLWAALADKNQVAEIDPANGQVLARVAVGSRPVSLLFDGGALWSADQAGNTVTRIDVTKASKIGDIAVPGGPYALAWAPCGPSCADLWVAGEANDTVSRIRVAGR